MATGEKAEYRNAIRSRSLIREAFVELMQVKAVERITVTDIVARADINRGTFYAHYRDPQAVLSQIEDEIVATMDRLIEQCNANDLIRDPLPILLSIGKLLEENLEHYRLLLKASGSGNFLRKLKSTFVERMVNDPRTAARYRNRAKFRATVTFFAGGLVAIYEDWFAGKLDKTLEEVAALVAELNPYRRH
jgi:AcrR family transcriptional regulator